MVGSGEEREGGRLGLMEREGEENGEEKRRQEGERWKKGREGIEKRSRGGRKKKGGEKGEERNLGELEELEEKR